MTHPSEEMYTYNFDEFIGQKVTTTTLRNFVKSAIAEHTGLDHVLLIGQHGIGKTTLAHVISNELGVNIRVTRGNAIERAGDCAAILTNLHKGDVLLVEDIHLLADAVAEVLAPAMADLALDIVIGKGPGARSIRLSLPQFTVIATTDTPALILPSVARAFPLVFRFQEYQTSDLEAIVRKIARRSDLQVDSKSCYEIAALARGVPRRALQLLRQWSILTKQRGGILSSSEALARLAQLAQDYQVVLEGLEIEQTPTTASVKKLIRQLDLRVEERLEELQARVNDLEDKIDELFGS